MLKRAAWRTWVDFARLARYEIGPSGEPGRPVFDFFSTLLGAVAVRGRVPRERAAEGVERAAISGLGGAADETASIGKIVGPGFSGAEVVDAVETIVDTYLAVRRDDEKFIDTHRRVGNAPFKEKLYATH